MLNNEIEDLKIKKAEMKNTVTEIKKKSLAGNNKIMQKGEELISEVEDVGNH